MANKDEELQQKFPDIRAVDEFLGRQRINLMDINTNVYKNALVQVDWLDEQVSQFMAVIEEMKVAYAVGALLSAQMVADRIRDDYGIQMQDMSEEFPESEEDEEEE